MSRKIKAMVLTLSLALLFGVTACSTNGETEGTTDGEVEQTTVDDTDETPDGEDDDTEETPDGEDDDTEETPDGEEGDDEISTIWPAHDLGGATIEALDYNSLNAANPDADDLADYDAETRQNKIDYLEDKYNVTIEYVPLPSVEWDEIPNEMIRRYTAGDPVADIFDVSFSFFAALASNGVLNDNTAWIDNVNLGESYTDVGNWIGSNYGVGTTVGGEGLHYNRTMIQDAGMEMEPNEMFARGQWSYEDFTQYLTDLNSRLPEDTSAFFIDPYYWFLFAPAGNGTQLITDEGVNYQDEAVIESLEALVTINNAGLLMEPNTTEEGGLDYWGTPQSTFDQGTGVALTHRASWQAAELAGSVDFGFVPYPYGANVSFGETGELDSYLTISDNYATTVFDAQMRMMTKGVEEKADPEGVFTLMLDLMGLDFMHNDYVDPNADTSGEVPARWFNTELDAELYDWSLGRERLEMYSPLRASLSLAGTYYDSILEGASLRSLIDAATPADQNGLIEAGIVEGELQEVPEDDTAEDDDAEE